MANGTSGLKSDVDINLTQPLEMSSGFDKLYWNNRYLRNETTWDIGYASPPLTAYFDQLSDPHISILIPGCGNAWEAEYLLQLGFDHIHLADIAPAPMEALQKKFSKEIAEGKLKLINADFFELSGKYDLIVEQTFFCAILPSLRNSYAKQMHRLLKPGGRLAGLLFDDPMHSDHPPFGGNKEEYAGYFEPFFTIKTLERCYNSIAPRKGKELFMILTSRPISIAS